MDRLSAMRLFVGIGQLNSFARAAESLGISSAAATERIRRLEAEVNAKLLNRATRRVRSPKRVSAIGKSAKVFWMS